MPINDVTWLENGNAAGDVLIMIMQSSVRKKQ